MMHPGRLREQQRKKLCWLKVGLPFLKTASMVTRGSKVTFGVRFCRTCRAKHNSTVVESPESGAGDADYVQRAMIHYEIDTGLPFKLRRCWEILKDHPKWKEIAIPNFNTVSKGGSKRHKSTGSSSFNIESGEASINLNTNVDDNDEDEVQKIQRPDGQEQSESCWEKEREKKERLTFLEIKRMEVECRERELEQQDMRFYLQSYDHLVGDQRKAMDEVRVEIKAKYNLQY
ncbi:gamma-glutamyltranspeptidase 1 [Tanacetum coccineum]